MPVARSGLSKVSWMFETWWLVAANRCSRPTAIVAGDRGGTDDVRELGAVVDDRVVGEERCDGLGLVLVEVRAVRVDQLLDLVPVDELLQHP